MVDSELAAVDSLLNDLGKQRFAAKAIKGISDPKRLSEFIPTAGWSPIQAELTVTDVAALVARLGGEELYGKDKSVPIRELTPQMQFEHAEYLKSDPLIGDRQLCVAVRMNLGIGLRWKMMESECPNAYSLALF
jgi:hypothetical protein